MNQRTGNDEQGKAPLVLRIFSAIVALPLGAAGVVAIVRQFPLGLIWGASLIASGVVAALTAIRGRVPDWLDRE